MDLIYATDEKIDLGAMQNFTFDLAFGSDENNFELKTDMNNHVCGAGYFLYIENTEYGGIIDRVRVQTDTHTLIYKGRTWHGILASKIFEPDIGEDYLVCSGEANKVLGALITRMNLTGLFKAGSSNSGLNIKNYKMNRYINGYEGIAKMLSSVGGKLKINFQEGYASLSAEPLVDYSKDEEFDSSQLNFDAEKNYNPINHVICLGQGELKERTVIHLYADSQGNISHTQSIFGMDEITAIYENVNAESLEELEKGGMDVLKESWDSDSVETDIDSEESYDIGDVVGAREHITDIFVAKPITKKIVTIKGDIVTTSYKAGK